jgi:hypothetical protein
MIWVALVYGVILRDKSGVLRDLLVEGSFLEDIGSDFNDFTDSLFGKSKDCTKPANAKLKECIQAKLDDLVDQVFPLYSGIQDTFMELNLTAPAILKDWARLTEQMNRINQQINGNDFSKGKDSLVSQVDLLFKSSQELAAISASGINELWSFAKSVQANAVNSTDTMKQYLGTSLEELTKKLAEASKLQSGIQTLRAKALTNKGNQALEEVSKSVTSKLISQASAIGNSSQTVSQISQTVENGLKKTAKSLDDADDAIISKTDEISQIVDSTVENVSTGIEAVSDEIKDQGKVKAGDVSMKTSKLSATMNQEESSKITGSNLKWKSQAELKGDSVASDILVVDGKVRQDVAGFENALDSKTSETISSSDAVRHFMDSRQQDIASSASDLQTSKHQVQDDTVDTDNSLSQDISQAIAVADSRRIEGKGKISELMRSSANKSSDQLESVLSQISAIMSSSSASSAEAKSKVQNLLSHIEEEFGQQTANTAKQLIDSQALTSKSSDEIRAIVMSGSDQTLRDGGLAASSVFSSLNDLGASVGDIGSGMNKKMSQSMEQAMSNSKELSKSASLKLNTAESEMDHFRSSTTKQNIKQYMTFQSEFSSAGSATDLVKAALNKRKSAGEKLTSELLSRDSNIQNQSADFADSLSAADLANSESLQRAASSASNSVDEKFTQMKSQREADLKNSVDGVESTLNEEILLNKRSLDQNRNLGETNESQISEFSGKLAQNNLAMDQIKNGLKIQKEDLQKDFNSRIDDSKTELAQTKADLSRNFSDQQSDLKLKLNESMKRELGETQSQFSKAFSMSSDSMASAQAQSSDLSQILQFIDDQKGFIPVDDTKLQNALSNINSGKSKDGESFETRLQEAQAEFVSIESQMKETTLRLKDSIKSKIGLIPGILSSQTADLAEQQSEIETDMNGKIHDLQVKAASSNSKQEKDAALEGLQALYRIQAVNDQIKQQKSDLLNHIASGTTVDSQRFTELQSMMDSLVDSVQTFNSNASIQKTQLNLKTEDIAKDVSQTFKSLNDNIDMTFGNLKNQGKSSFIDSDFHRQLQFTQYQQALTKAQNAVNITSRLSSNHVNDLFDDERGLQDEIARLKNGTLSVSDSLKDLFLNATDFINQSKLTLQSIIGESSSETHSRMSSVKSALHGFMKLWNEYSKYMTEKLKSFNKSDDQTLQSLDLNAKNKIISYETKLSDLIDGISTDYNKLNATITNENEFESMILEHLVYLKQQESSINNQTISTITDINSKLLWFEEKLSDQDSVMAETIKKQLDGFDEELLDKQTMAAAGMSG